MNIGIYIYDDAEVLDFSGPFEVFSTAARVSGKPDLYNVFLIGETGNMITARGGYLIMPHYSFSSHPSIDMLIVVGGVHTRELSKQDVLQWIQQQADKAELVASVCTGAFLLAEAGVLPNTLPKPKVTTHWEDIPDLRAAYPHLDVVEQQRWVDIGEIVTSGGISAGIDMSLYLVSKTNCMNLAERTAKQMEFDWTKNIKRANNKKAD